MKRRKCNHCGRSFVVTSRHPDQTYCSRKECQRARKTDWQRRKLASDEDYRVNQAACWADWASRHPGYWKRYREKHPEYVQRNKEKQRERNRINRAKPPLIATSSNNKTPFISGYYELIPVADTPCANMEPILVRIHEAACPRAPL